MLTFLFFSLLFKSSHSYKPSFFLSSLSCPPHPFSHRRLAPTTKLTGHHVGHLTKVGASMPTLAKSLAIVAGAAHTTRASSSILDLSQHWVCLNSHSHYKNSIIMSIRDPKKASHLFLCVVLTRVLLFYQC